MAQKGFMKKSRERTKCDLARYLIEGDFNKETMADLLFYTCAPGSIVRDPKRAKRAKGEITKMMKDPDFKEIYRQEMLSLAAPKYSRAMHKLEEQLDSNQPWLVNKAANDLINQYKAYVVGDDDKSLTIKVEGMPDLGTPDGDK